MATTELVAPFPKLRFVDSNGNALSGGKLFTYTGGTTTKTNTFTDSTGATPNANPILLDTRGECNCWIPANTNIKFVLSPSTDTDPPTNAIWTVDNVSSNLPATSIIPCTATGTNTIALTPVSGSVTSYTDQQQFSFYAAANNTGATTINVQSVGAKNLYLSDGVTAAGSGALVSGQLYEVAFSSAANSNAGGFILITPVLISAANTLRGNNTGSKAATVDLTISQVAAMLPFRSYLAGLTLSNDGVTPNTVLDIAAGVAMDSTNAIVISLAAFTKTTGGVWVAGTGNAGMGTGLTIANSTWYHVFAIINAGVADVYFDTSVTAANKPAGTTAFRRLGSFLTSGAAAILLFTQTGDEFWWSTPPALDVNAVGTTANRTLSTMTVPLGVKVKWIGNVYNFEAAAGPGQGIYLSDPANADVAPSLSASPLSTSGFSTGATNTGPIGQASVWTNTSSQIGVRVLEATDAIKIQTLGWLDTRGRFN